MPEITIEELEKIQELCSGCDLTDAAIPRHKAVWERAALIYVKEEVRRIVFDKLGIIEQFVSRSQTEARAARTIDHTYKKPDRAFLDSMRMVEETHRNYKKLDDIEAAIGDMRKMRGNDKVDGAAQCVAAIKKIVGVKRSAEEAGLDAEDEIIVATG